jgi:hypothetical protein
MGFAANHIEDPKTTSWPLFGSSQHAWRGRVMVAGKLLISIAIVAYLARTQRLGFERLRGAFDSPLNLCLVFGLLLVVPFVLTLRWEILLRSLGYRLRFRDVLSLTFIVVFFDTVMPGGTADIIRGYFLDRNFQPEKRGRALSTVVVDRFLGLMGLVLSALAALAVKSHTSLAGTALHSVALSAGVVGLVFVAIFAFLVAKGNPGRFLLERLCARIPVLELLLRIYDAFRSYTESGFALVRALGVSILGHALTISCFLLLGWTLGEGKLSTADYFCLVPLGLFVAQIPISPGGIGVGHVGFYTLFLMAGSKQGADVFSLFIFVRFLASLPGLVCFLRNRRPESRPEAARLRPVAFAGTTQEPCLVMIEDGKASELSARAAHAGD